MTTDNPTRSRIIADTIRPHMDAWFPGSDPEARETMSAETFKTMLEAVAAAAYDRASPGDREDDMNALRALVAGAYALHQAKDSNGTAHLLCLALREAGRACHES